MTETFAGGLLPFVCFLIAWDLPPSWQDDRVSTYVQLFLNDTGSRSFGPLLLAAGVALLMAVWTPDAARWGLVRFFVATGVVLAVQYVLAMALILFSDQHGPATSIFFGIFGGALLLLVSALFFRWLRWVSRRFGWPGLLLHALPVFLLASMVDSMGPFDAILVILLVGTFYAAPLWAVAAYSRHCLEWLREDGFPDSTARRSAWLVLSGGWIFTWWLAWKQAALRVLEAYGELPQEPSGCYLATVAARGHEGFVGSKPGHSLRGSFPVNRQLRRLKAFEVVLKWAFPSLHRRLRRTYDFVGPSLSRRLESAWAADVTWLLLKPLELLAGLFLRGIGATGAIDRIWPSARAR